MHILSSSLLPPAAQVVFTFGIAGFGGRHSRLIAFGQWTNHLKSLFPCLNRPFRIQKLHCRLISRLHFLLAVADPRFGPVAHVVLSMVDFLVEGKFLPSSPIETEEKEAPLYSYFPFGAPAHLVISVIDFIFCLVTAKE